MRFQSQKEGKGVTSVFKKIFTKDPCAKRWVVEVRLSRYKYVSCSLTFFLDLLSCQ